MLSSKNSLKFVFLFSFLFVFKNSYAQFPFGIVEGRQEKFCENCMSTISSMPPEVMFGIQINTNGDIYFSMSNKVWFDKIFKNKSYGVTIDLVSKERYNCNKNLDDGGLPKGTVIMPVYKPELIKNMEEANSNNIFVKIGNVPPKLMNKELEGNLIILNGNLVCYYSNFVNIDRSVWQLLPMGLFTDSLLSNNVTNNSGSEEKSDFFTYSKKVQITIPFAKGSSKFDSKYLKGIYDSLQLEKYKIRKVDVRAYSSIEGLEKTNNELMKKRADSIISAIKKYEPSLKRINVITAENWLDFFNDIELSKHDNFKSLSKLKIKQKLSDKILLQELEPYLTNHRKAIATIYLELKSSETLINNTLIISDFKKAVSDNDLSKAKNIQKELVERIMDNKLPLEYVNQLEVPKSKEFSSLLNDKEVYKYLLKATNEYEALENFKQLKKLDPENGKINYNVCALKFFIWKNGGDSFNYKILLKEINKLSEQGINKLLVKRMLINYHILKSEENMMTLNYAGKDSSLNIIKSIFSEIEVNDEDIFSLAKYYSYYSQFDWAEEIITPRIGKIDVSENLIFYYLNLLFFHPNDYDSENFQKSVLNAINLNSKRFCNFFMPNDNGGASMQLLEYEEIREKYCEECK